MMQNKYLKDTTFIKDFNNLRLKEQFIRIALLDFTTEKVIDHIEGRAISGSLSIQRNSKFRRSCNLTMTVLDSSSEVTELDSLFSINKKISLEIKYKNPDILKEKYPEYADYEYISFPQGIFVITSASLSRDMSDTTISLSLQDKMAYLSGVCGGTFPASTTLNSYREIVIGEDGKEKEIEVELPIYQIIQELVHHFGGEQLGRIIIELDTKIAQRVQWKGTAPLYLVAVPPTAENPDGLEYTLTPPADEKLIKRKFVTNDSIGRYWVDFVYPVKDNSNFVQNAGTTVCDALDAINNILGGMYEYYYDIDGNFIFREIRNYVNTSGATSVMNLSGIDYLSNTNIGSPVYVFDEDDLVINYNRDPHYDNIKNDFIVTSKEAKEGNVYTYHLVIDKKPVIDPTVDYQVFTFTTTDSETSEKKTYYKTVYEFDSLAQFPIPGTEGIICYSQMDDIYYSWVNSKEEYVEIDEGQWEKHIIKGSDIKDYRNLLFLTGAYSEKWGGDTGAYYAELKEFWPKQYDVLNNEWLENSSSNITYYFDIVEMDETAHIGVSDIGRRTKVDSSLELDYIFGADVPDIILVSNKLDQKEKDTQIRETIRKNYNYKLIEDENIYNNYEVLNDAPKSAYDAVTNLMYTHTKYADSVSMNLLPIYNLDSNNMIEISDSKSGIYGYYLINTITVPFEINGTMSLTCEKIITKR